MHFDNFKRFFLSFAIFGIISLEKCYVAAQSSQSINVLFINEVDNELATKAVDVALTYLEKNPSYDITVKIDKIESDNADAKILLENICTRYAESIEKKQPPHVILDTTKMGVVSDTVKAFTQTLGLPIVTASYGREGDLRQWNVMGHNQQKYLLQVIPPSDMIIEVVYSIVKRMNMANAAILYDETFRMDHKMNSLLGDIHIRHVITEIAKNGRSGRSEQITKLGDLDITNFFILGTLKAIHEVLESVPQRFFDRNFAWHAITLDEGEISTQRDNIRVMFLKPMAYPKHRDRLSLLKTTFNLIEEPQIISAFYFDLALRTFLAIKEMLQSGIWPNDMEYLGCEGFEGENTPERVIDLNQYFMQIAEPTSYGEFKFSTEPGKPFNGYSYMQFEMNINKFETRRGNSMNKNSIGSWTAGLKQELLVKDEGSIKNLTADTVYRIYTIVQAPFIIKDENAPKGYKGFCIDMIEEIAAIIHFNYVIEEVEDGKFGNMDEKGNWNGIVKKLMEKEADIGLGSMSVMSERETVIDFTIPFYDLVGIAIMLKAPKPMNSIYKYLTVMETSVWLWILAAYFVTSFLIWAFDRWSPFSYQHNMELYKGRYDNRYFDLKECFWFCLTSLTPQGSGLTPKNISGRMVGATWWLFAFIVVAAYTANLAAFLTVSQLDTPVHSLDELAKQHKIAYAPLKDSMATTYFQRMSNIEKRFYKMWKNLSLYESHKPTTRSKLAVWEYPVSDKFTKMWQTIQEAGLPATLEEAVERVRNPTEESEFAFLGDGIDVRYLVMTNCDLQSLDEEFSRKPYAIAVQQGSHLKDEFNNAISILLSKGQLEKLKEKWWSKDNIRAECEQPEDPMGGITMKNIGGVFLIIFYGIGVSCMAVVFEIWWYQFYKKARVIDVVEATIPPQSPSDKENEIVAWEDQTATENDDVNGVALRTRYNVYPASFKPKF